jgi:hypothetical protein
MTINTSTQEVRACFVCVCIVQRKLRRETGVAVSGRSISFEPRSPDALVNKARLHHLFGQINVAVDGRLPASCHHLLKAIEVKRTKLFPFRDDDQRVRAFRTRCCNR